MQDLLTYWPLLTSLACLAAGWGAHAATDRFREAQQSDHSDEIDALTVTVVELSATVKVLDSQVGDLRRDVRDLTRQLRERQ